MKIVCPYCAVKGTLPDSLLHRDVRCPRCKQIFRADAEVEFLPVEEVASSPQPPPSPPPQQPPLPQTERTTPRQVMPQQPTGQRPERVITLPDAELNNRPLGKIAEIEALSDIDVSYLDEQSAPPAPPVPPVPPRSKKPAAPATPPPKGNESRAQADTDTLLFEKKPLCAGCGRQVDDDENFSFGRTGLLCPSCRTAEESAEDPGSSAEGKPAIDWDAAATASGWRRENELREIALSGRKRAASPNDFTIFSILSETWEKLKGVKRDVWGAVAIIVLLNLILGTIAHFLPATKTAAGLVGLTVVGVIAFFLNSLLLSGLGYLGLCQARDKEGGWDTMFVCFSPMNLVKLLLLFIMQPIVIAFGLLCLVVPGVYLMTTLSFSPLLILDKGMWPWEAMLDSRRTSHINCLKIFLLYLIASVGFYAAAILLLVGLFWMLPFVFVLYGIIHRRLFDGA